MDSPHLLVVDDDQRLRGLLQKFLGDNGYLVTVAEDAQDARDKLARLTFDLVVLDVMMPGETGLELAADLRRHNDIPILMLTAMGEPEDRITGLEAGADDYLSKPFEPRELLLRVTGILRRSAQAQTSQQQSVVVLGRTVFDPAHETLTRNGRSLRLTTTEAGLLGALAKNAGRVLGRDELTRLSGTLGGERSIDVQVTRLRKKIGDDPRAPRYLQTVRGRGYVLRPD